VPDMASVFRWRLQQESEIETGQRVMNEAQVRRFIMYYQRIAERMLQARDADITLALRTDHGIGEMVLSA